MKKQTKNEICCENCRFWFEKANQCRRYPPQVWADEITLGSTFPSAQPSDWCGEFSNKPHAVAYVEVSYE